MEGEFMELFGLKNFKKLMKIFEGKDFE